MLFYLLILLVDSRRFTPKKCPLACSKVFIIKYRLDYVIQKLVFVFVLNLSLETDANLEIAITIVQ